MKDKLRILLRIALVLLLVCGVTVGVLYANRDIGIPTDQLEQAMRESQDIPDDWTVQTSAGDTTAAGIAYAPNHSDYSFSLYIDRDTHRFFTTGWFFTMSGSLFEISDFVAAFTVNARPAAEPRQRDVLRRRRSAGRSPNCPMSLRTGGNSHLFWNAALLAAERSMFYEISYGFRRDACRVLRRVVMRRMGGV